MKVRNLFRCTRGSMAVEFCVIVLMLFSIYIGTTEIFIALDTNKKLNLMNAGLADLIGKLESTKRSDIEDIAGLSELELQPYHRSKPILVFTALETIVGSSNKAKVVWSLKADGSALSSPLPAGGIVDLPSDIGGSGSHLIRVESTLSYKPIFTWPFEKAFTMRKVNFILPRFGKQSVICNDCTI